MSGYKRCRDCGEEKPRSQFAMPGGRPSSICRNCYRDTGSQAQLPSSSRTSREVRDYHDQMAAQYWQQQITAASLAQRGRHELAVQKRKELRREKWKDRFSIAVFVATHVARMLTWLGQPLVRACAACAGIVLAAWGLSVLF
jgi:ribosomal protein S14